MTKKKKPSEIFKKILKFFINTYSLGLVITFVVLSITFNYYVNKENPEPPWIVQVLKRAHQSSIDFRFKARGNRAVSNDVALITIDEKAVEQEGRWPWPRVKIKRLIENLVRDGAKVIGFDVIFAEEDVNSAVVALQELKANPALPTNLTPILDEAMSKANTDNDLAQAVKTNAEKLVIGVYFDDFGYYYEEGHADSIPGYQNLCFNLLYKNSDAFKVWDSVKEPILFIDKTSALFDEEMPEAWSEIMIGHQTALEKRASEEFYSENKIPVGTELNKTREVELKHKIKIAYWKYCKRWLKNPQEYGEPGIKSDENYEAFKAAWPKVAADLEPKDQKFETIVSTIFETHKTNPVTQAGQWWFNYKGITESIQHLGYFNAFQDSDGTIRKTSLVTRSGNNYYPSLALKTFLVAMGYNASITLDHNDVELNKKRITNFALLKEGEPVGEIPVNGRSELLINFAGPYKMFPHISVADILNDDKQLSYEQMEYDENLKFWRLVNKRADKKEFLKDKILLLGATATGIYDLRVTPFQENYPGLETHANIIDNLLQNNFYSEHSQELEMIALLFILGVTFTFLVGYLGAVPGLLLSASSTLAIYYYDKYYMFNRGIVTPIIFPILLLGGIYLMLTAFKYFTEERNKKMLKSTFQKYVSPAIVNEILSDPDKIELGGRKMHMTVFFSDVRGFTTISEKLDPRALSDLLNSYLTPMTDLVFKNRGTLDKYMGDAVMAFFGAPIPYKDHAAWGCRCALQQLAKLHELQALYRQQGLPEIDIGIGLNTGDMSVGNMGSETVRNYTVMGDAVNLGSRLEGINKQYGTRIIISEFTESEIRGQFVTRELDWVRVKGKIKPVKIFELIAEGTSVSPNMTETIKFFNDGYAFYHQMKWDAAVEYFNKALVTMPDDGPSKLYLERCLEYKAEPPPQDWDGVFVMKTK